MKTAMLTIALIFSLSFSQVSCPIAQTYINGGAYSTDPFLKRPNVEIVVAEVLAVEVIHENKLLKTHFKVIEVVRGEKTSTGLSYLWPIEIPNRGHLQSKKRSIPGPVVGDRLILYGNKEKDDNFAVYEAIRWTPNNIRAVKSNMTVPRTAEQTKIDNVIFLTIFIGILVSAILMIAIGGALLNYVQQIRSKKTVVGIISVFTISVLASFPLINLLIAIPALAIIPAIIFIILGLNSYSLKTTWDRKTAQACFLAGIVWLLYCLYEMKMKTSPGAIRVDLLFVAPIIFGEAAITFCVTAVHLSDKEKNELTTRSSR